MTDYKNKTCYKVDVLMQSRYVQGQKPINTKPGLKANQVSIFQV